MIASSNRGSVESSADVLTVEHLDIVYDTAQGPLATVRGVSLRIEPGETYGLVGESGSGKTTLARGIVRYLPANGRITAGQVRLLGMDLTGLSRRDMRRVWGAKISMVHQDPTAAVNPAIRIGEQIAEVARAHLGLSKAEAYAKAMEMLAQVGMPDPEAVALRYAHQLSGGMLQRVLIAVAVTANPSLLIMDEPTTALDVTTEAVILDIVQELVRRRGLAVLYITHNLGVVARVCDRVGVMYAGQLVEEGPVRDVFKRPLHPYTFGLLRCVPRVAVDKSEVELYAIPGYIPRPDELPPGCVFAPRCAMTEDACLITRPLMVGVGERRLSACLRWAEVQRELSRLSAPKAEARPASAADDPPLLRAEGMKKYFKNPGRLLSLRSRRGALPVRAVDGISVGLRAGTTLGIVGESGCGKTTLVRCICGLEEATEGRITLAGVSLARTVARRERSALRKMQMVFQNPDVSLNPQRTVGEMIGRPLGALAGVSKDDIPQRVADLLEAVHLPASYAHRLPHELSGGEKQRVAIARAFAADPKVVICDEPISSLDVSVQASLMNLLVDLQASDGTAYLFVSHDLAAVRHVSDWIAVVYLGRLWEVGPAKSVFGPPFHPYTEALMSALPIPDSDVEQHRIRLAGSVPSAVNIPPGCRFHTRCPRKIGALCETQEPPWRPVGSGHEICCHIPVDDLVAMQHAFFTPSKRKEAK